jgi:hypothetical protein
LARNAVCYELRENRRPRYANSLVSIPPGSTTPLARFILTRWTTSLAHLSVLVSFDVISAINQAFCFVETRLFILILRQPASGECPTDQFRELFHQLVHMFLGKNEEARRIAGPLGDLFVSAKTDLCGRSAAVRRFFGLSLHRRYAVWALLTHIPVIRRISYHFSPLARIFPILGPMMSGAVGPPKSIANSGESWPGAVFAASMSASGR